MSSYLDVFAQFISSLRRNDSEDTNTPLVVECEEVADGIDAVTISDDEEETSVDEEETSVDEEETSEDEEETSEDEEETSEDEDLMFTSDDEMGGDDSEAESLPPSDSFKFVSHQFLLSAEIEEPLNEEEEEKLEQFRANRSVFVKELLLGTMTTATVDKPS